MIKKFLASFIITTLLISLSPIWTTFAINKNSLKSEITKELILSKANLNKTLKWKKHIRSADLFIQKINTDIIKMQKISNKIDILLDKNSITDKNTLNLIIYLWANIKLILIKNIDNNFLDDFPDDFKDIENYHQNTSLNQSIKEDKKLYIEDINQDDKKLIEDKIINLQLNLLNKSENLIKSLTKKFEQISNYEDIWTFELDYNLNIENEWKWSFNLKVNDYKNQVSNFNSQFKWEISTSMEAFPKNQDEVKLNLSWLVDFISKDWDIYVLLEKFKITDRKWIEELKLYLDKLEKIAEENKYIIYSDNETKAGIRILKSLNPNILLNDSRKILSKAFFTAYSKKWNKYLLKPTKYACEQIMILSNKINPYVSSTCTDDMYNELLKELSKSWELYAELLENNKTKIWFIASNFDKVINKNEWYILFNDSEVLELNYAIDATTKWWMLLNYKTNSYLTFTLKVEDEINIQLSSTLNKENKFTKIDFTWVINDNREKHNYNLKLENKNITWDFSVDISSYDWNTWLSTLTNRFSWDISWKTDFNNELAKLEISYTWQDLIKKEEHINWSLYLTQSQLIFKNKTEFDRSKSNIIISWKLDSKKLLNSWGIKISVSEKEYLRYDKETYKSIYSDTYNEVFNTDIEIKNKNISGQTTISDKWEEVMNITHEWNFSEKKLKLDNEFTFSEKSSLEANFSTNTSKARDSVRISDLYILSTYIELYFQEEWMYPSENEFMDNYPKFITTLPKDPSWNIEINWCKFWYLYEVWKDKDWVNNWEYKLSTCLENPWEKTENDGWNNNKKFEKWINIKETKSELFYINWYNSWKKVIKQNEIIDIITWNLDIDIDYSNNQNNIYLFLNVLLWNKEVFSGFMKNTWKRVYKKTEIITPTNTIDYKEVFDISGKNDYY